MKILKFTIKRADCEHLIHNIQALKKKHDNERNNTRFIALNLLEGDDNIGLIKKMFGIKERVRIIVQIDRAVTKLKGGLNG